MKKNVYAIIAIALVAVLALVGVACSVRAATMKDTMPISDFENRKNLMIAQAWDSVFGNEEVMEMVSDGRAVIEVNYDYSIGAFCIYEYVREDDEIIEITAEIPFNEDNCRDFYDADDLFDEREARVWTETHIDLTK